jgi:Ni/Co efflux regulator RcnB
MSKLWLIGLAASAAWTPAAIAQGAPPPPPPPPIAQGAHAPGHGGMSMQGGGHHSMPPAMHGGGQMHGQMHGQMKGFQRFGRGHVIPPHFRGRQFVVQDWRTFGFPAPMQGGQWIRYYDDALLIDGDGRVMDGRYGWDWDGGGGRMADGDDHHDGDYGRDEDYGDDEWAEDGHHGDRQRVVRIIRRGDGARGDCRRGCARVRHMPPPPPHPGYGQGYGQGYGYGYGGYGYGYGAGCGCGPVVITETITTTAPVVEMRTYYETVREPRVAPRRHVSKPVVRHYSRPVVRRSVKAAPAPRPGERG